MKYKKFIVYFIIFLILLLCPLGLSYVFLRNAGETLTGSEVSMRQLQESQLQLFGSAIFQDTKKIKLTSYGALKPTVITLGSSRAGNMRKQFFKDRFYSLSRVMTSIQDGLYYVPHFLKIHKPEVIIFTVDYWWFNDVKEGCKSNEKNLNILDNKINVTHLFIPFKWLLETKISWNFLINIFMKDTKNRNIGVRALLKDAGEANDGSIFYPFSLPPIQNTSGLIDIIEGRDLGSRHLSNTMTFSETKFCKFKNLLALIKSSGARVLVIFPPQPPSFAKLMKKYSYENLQSLFQRLEEDKIEYLNFSSPTEWFEVTDGEFHDIVHASDIVGVKTLLSIVKKHPWVRKYINEAFLRGALIASKGKESIPRQMLNWTKSRH